MTGSKAYKPLGKDSGTFRVVPKRPFWILKWSLSILIPNLDLPEKASVPLGRYGRMRKAYLEEHRPGLYERLLLSGKLYEHLAEIDACCAERIDQIIRQMADAEGVTEDLKARDQMTWVCCMNSILQRAEEIILSELIYD